MRHIVPLSEIKISPATLQKFVKSKQADGIKVGIEAELIFRNILTSDAVKPSPDYEKDEEVSTIEELVNFYFGFDESRADTVEAQLRKKYAQWAGPQLQKKFSREKKDYITNFVMENYWSWEERVEEYLTDVMGLEGRDLDEAMEKIEPSIKLFKFLVSNDPTRIPELATKKIPDKYDRNVIKAQIELYDELQDEVADIIESKDLIYDDAVTNFLDENSPTEEEWLRDIGISRLKDVPDVLGYRWPFYLHITPDGIFNNDVARSLAKDLKSVVGSPVGISDRSGTVERDAYRWIIEPDPSIQPDEVEDMAVEIISPPMELKNAIPKLERFFKWVRNNNGYANHTTGFHVNISLPEVGGRVDYLKLALFMGDEYILEQFGRAANTYCKSFVQQLKKNYDRINPSSAMDKVYSGLNTVALDTIKKSQLGKNFSINPKGEYIEFRSTGGNDYFNEGNIEKLFDTVSRYAQAMTIAADDNLHKEEYYKKLYKLLSPQKGTPLDMFVSYSSGKMNAEQLKKVWSKKMSSVDSVPDAWSIIDNKTKQVVGHISSPDKSPRSAIKKAMSKMNVTDELEFSNMYDVVKTTNE